MSMGITSMEDDDITICTSNTHPRSTQTNHIVHHDVAGGCLTLPTMHAIADSSATQIFVMDGMPVKNKQPTSQPLAVTLVYGQ